MILDNAQFTFDYFYHMDKANACIHCAPVRFSPLTFRLAEQLMRHAQETGQDVTAEVAEVMIHRGQYEEDKGR
jgi:hypothetical protein